MTVDEMVDTLENYIHKASSHIEYRTVKCSAKDTPWVTVKLKDIINKRWRAYRMGNFDQYRHYQQKVKDEIFKIKTNYVSKSYVFA